MRWLGFDTPQPAWAPVAEAMPLEGIEIDLVELHVTHDMVITGRRLAEPATPDGSIVTAIVPHPVISPVPRPQGRGTGCGDTGGTAADRVRQLLRR